MARTGRPLPLFLAGLLLLLLGIAWATVETQGYLPRLVAASGALLLALFALRHAREIRFLLLQVRAHSEPGPGATLLLLALVLVLGALAAGRWVAPADLTLERFHSLSPASRRTLAELSQPVRLEAFFAEPSAEADLARRVLDLYARSSRHVRSALYDPDRDPGRAREAGVQRPGTIFISVGNARTQIFELSEAAITQGILRVLEGRPRRVGLLQGHGEPVPELGGETGISAWLAVLRAANVEASPLRLLELDDVPDDLDAVVVVRPRHPLYPSEVSALRRYLERGGRVGVWSEPGDSTGLEEYLRFHYVEALPGAIRDPGRLTAGLGLGPWSPALVFGPGHPITAGLGTYVVASGVHGWRIISPHPIDLEIEPILSTAGPVEVLPEIGGEEVEPLRRGPELAAVALSWEVAVGEDWRAQGGADRLPPVKPLARLALFGDASLLTNRFLGQGANQDLAVSAVHWLTFQERFLGITSRRLRPGRLTLGLRGLRTLLYLVEFGLPLLLVASGAWVWMRRRAGGAR